MNGYRVGDLLIKALKYMIKESYVSRYNTKYAAVTLASSANYFCQVNRNQHKKSHLQSCQSRLILTIRISVRVSSVSFVMFCVILGHKINKNT